MHYFPDAGTVQANPKCDGDKENSDFSCPLASHQGYHSSPFMGNWHEIGQRVCSLQNAEIQLGCIVLHQDTD